MSDDEFDNIPDDFADVQGVDWAELLAGPAHASHMRSEEIEQRWRTRSAETPYISPESNSLSSSSYFSDDDDMDSSFFAELDRVEQRITHAPVVASSRFIGDGAAAQPTTAARGAGTSSSAQLAGAHAPQPLSHRTSEVVSSTTRHFSNRVADRSLSPQKLKAANAADSCDVEQTSNVPCKRPCADSHLVSPKRKGKLKASDDTQEILSAYEEEITCPICCDIFVASHVGNPCGHTFCGECGWLWHVENKKKECPCCRGSLDEKTPMIPNIAMDNVVEKHVRALVLSGAQEWEPGGRKYQEWDARKQAWRKGAEKRQQKKARLASKARSFFPIGAIQVFDAPLNWVMEDNMEEDPTYEDSDVELIPRPIRRPQRRRQRGAGGVAIIDVG